MKRSRQNKTVKPTSRTRSKKRLLYLLVFLLLAALPLITFNKWANQPSSETIVIGNDVSRKTVTPKFQPLKTAYFSLMVPAGWQIRKETDTTTPNRLHILVHATGGNSQAAISSNLLPTEGLQGVADYHLRATDSANYLETSESDFAIVTKAFKPKNGVGETVFMVNNGRYASLTVSGQETSEQSYSLLKTMLSSWRWVR